MVAQNPAKCVLECLARAPVLVLPPLDTYQCYKFLQITSQGWAEHLIGQVQVTPVARSEKGDYLSLPFAFVGDLGPPFHQDLHNEEEPPSRRVFKCQKAKN